MKAKTVIIVFMLLFPMLLPAQEVEYDTIGELIIYNRERAGLFTVHSSGLGLGYRAGKNQNAFNTRILSFELSTQNSLKQMKLINPFYANSKRYVFGKLNDILLLRASYGFNYLLNRKPYWGGVELRWLWEAGPVLGFEKPYYLYVVTMDQNSQGEMDYFIITDKFGSDNLWVDIYGRAPFKEGFNELRLVPGAFGKIGFQVEFGNVSTSIKALETGVVLSFFPQKIYMMDDDQNNTLLLNFYISYGFGKRFNKY